MGWGGRAWSCSLARYVLFPLTLVTQRGWWLIGRANSNPDRVPQPYGVPTRGSPPFCSLPFPGPAVAVPFKTVSLVPRPTLQ